MKFNKDLIEEIIVVIFILGFFSLIGYILFLAFRQPTVKSDTMDAYKSFFDRPLERVEIYYYNLGYKTNCGVSSSLFFTTETKEEIEKREQESKKKAEDEQKQCLKDYKKWCDTHNLNTLPYEDYNRCKDIKKKLTTHD